MRKKGDLVSINEGRLSKDGIVKIRPWNTDPSKSYSINEEFDAPLMKVTGIGDNKNRIDKNQFAWVQRNNAFFISAKPNCEAIPAGLYDIKSSYEQGLYIEKRSVILDEIFQLPDEISGKVITDVEKFWASGQKYKDYGITYKRGILLYGPPGTGKTSLLNLLISRIIDAYDGITVNMDSIDTFIPMVQNIRALEPDRPLLAIIEDLDGFLQYNSIKNFLNLLDGNMAADNIVYLATTNYIERIEDRVKRSSRFDRKYIVDLPKDDARMFYLKNKLKPEDAEKINMDKMVSDTSGMSFADIKELILSVCVFDIPYEEALRELKIMNNIKV